MAFLTNAARSIVSKSKKRFVEDGFDLDLSYITEKIIAMGFPSTGMEGIYRNNREDVKRFFRQNYDKHYKVYNLCSERDYELVGEFDEVMRYPFDDHNVPPLQMIYAFCQDVDEYLKRDDKNVVAIHCKAGKGRTGLMIACYLLYSGHQNTPQDALALFSRQRTENMKGVTIPSQARYVHYFQRVMQHPERDYFTENPLQITHIRLVTVPLFDPIITGGGCDPYFHVMCLKENKESTCHSGKAFKVFNYKKEMQLKNTKLKHFRSDERFADLDCSSLKIVVRGDVKLIFYDADQYSSDDKMFHLWFNTSFVENSYLCFERAVVDDACKDKNRTKFDAMFKVEIFFHAADKDDFRVHHEHEKDEVNDDSDDSDGSE